MQGLTLQVVGVPVALGRFLILFRHTPGTHKTVSSVCSLQTAGSERCKQHNQAHLHVVDSKRLYVSCLVYLLCLSA